MQAETNSILAIIKTQTDDSERERMKRAGDVQQEEDSVSTEKAKMAAVDQQVTYLGQKVDVQHAKVCAC